MASQQYGKGTIAILGAVAAAVVVTLFGVLQWDWQGLRPVSPAPTATAEKKAVNTEAPAAERQAAPLPGTAAPAPQTEAAVEVPQREAAAEAPSFDIVRVEPNGESVIAGRAAAGATIELLRDGQVHARTAADPSGLFAFVPPALPAGSHQISLQSIAPDGTRQRSRDSVTIVIAAKGDTRPLVTLASPDRPTVVLSSPEPPQPAVASAPQPSAPAEPPKEVASAAMPPVQAAEPPPAPAAPAAAAPASRPDVKIVSVDAEESGRLFVSGEAAPGATVRLYLNESFIAPGGVGGDGKVSFAIGRGVKPGDYRIRLDDVDPVSGSVRSRAEVAFNVPIRVASADPSIPAATGARPPSASASPGSSQPAQPDGAASGERAAGAGEAQVASAGSPERPLGPGTVMIPDVNTAIVSRGDNLWRISQRIYGRGYRYTVIFGANQQQIRNPNLIYPGQVFVLPADEAQKQKKP